MCTVCVLTLTCGSVSSPANCETHTLTEAMNTCRTANTCTPTPRERSMQASINMHIYVQYIRANGFERQLKDKPSVAGGMYVDVVSMQGVQDHIT